MMLPDQRGERWPEDVNGPRQLVNTAAAPR